MARANGGYALVLSQHLGLKAQSTHAEAAHWQRLQDRPAFQRALRVEQVAALEQHVDPTPSPKLRL